MSYFERLRHKGAVRFYRFRGKLLHSSIHILLQLRLLLRWVLIALILGTVLGFVGTLFVWCIGIGTEYRAAHQWCYLLLPVGGCAIVFLYHITKDKHDKGTNMVIASLRSEAQLPVQMAPLIFVTTIITHFVGGSAGREGAALQLGGGLGDMFGRVLHLRDKDKRTLIISGMSAAFSAIFRTPVAASIFAMEVGCVGTMQYSALVPAVIASLMASYVAGKLGLPLAHYNVLQVPEFSPVTGLKIILLGMCCALISILFCVILHRTEHIMRHRVKNPYLRILLASGILMLLGIILHTEDYFGIGTESILGAVFGFIKYLLILKES